MTTTREEFEAFAADRRMTLERSRVTIGAYAYSTTQDAWDAWQAAHLAGQRAMQERAARHCDNFSLAVSDSEWANGYATALKDAACGILAMEVKPS